MSFLIDSDADRNGIQDFLLSCLVWLDAMNVINWAQRNQRAHLPLQKVCSSQWCQLAWGVRKAEMNWCNRWLFVLLFCAVHVPIETMCPHTPVLGEMPSSCSSCSSQSYFCNMLLGQVSKLYTTMGYSRSSKNNTEWQLKSSCQSNSSQLHDSSSPIP